jgi:hypothetical protein
MKENAKLSKLVKALEQAIRMADQLEAEIRNNGKSQTEKPPRGAKRWKCDTGRRGRVPNWVLKATGTDSKAEVVRKFGHGFKFIEGVAPEIG